MRVSVTTCVALAAVLVFGGCTSTPTLTAPDTHLSISPSDGSEDVAPDTPIVVKAGAGLIKNVTVVTEGTRVEGALGSGGRTWQSRWTLDPGQKYHVIATALGADGRTQTITDTFVTRTLKSKDTIQAAIEAPEEGETVGIGMPILLHFVSDIKNRAEVERALEVRSSVPVAGAWHWLDNQNLIFRTKDYWPIHTKVEFIGHLSGVRGSKDKYTTQNFDRHFTIGDSHVAVASSQNHEQTVSVNGKLVRTMAISMGRGGSRQYTTTNGIHLAMDKAYLTVMESPPGSADYYRENVYWTVRISDTGEYEHSAPWSVGDQGNQNVSHGCINLSPSDAIWFYHFSNRGDIIKVTGTDRELEPDNGWGYWQEDWPAWLKYSALHQAITTATLDGTAISTVPVTPPVAVAAPPHP